MSPGKSKKKSRTAKRESQPNPPKKGERGNLLTRLLFRPQFLVAVVAAIALTFVVPYAMEYLPDLSGRDEYRVTADQIVINEPPHWVSRKVVQEAMKRSGLADSLSVLDSDSAEQIAQAFRDHPWISKVVSVSKSYPAKIEVELEYRRPVAMVRLKQGLYPVDANGVLLPSADFPISEAERYPVIANITSTPEGPEGTRWGDVCVTGGARIAEIMLPQPAEDEETQDLWTEFKISEIRAPKRQAADEYVEDLTFEFVTDGGSRIIWGRAPGSSHPGELETEQKIGRIREYIATYGGLDEPDGPYELDIRHWQHISRIPLTAERQGRDRF